MTHPFIRIDKCSASGAWYSDRIGQLFAIEREERVTARQQGLLDDVYWVREGGEWNLLNWVLQRDATKVDAAQVRADIAATNPEPPTVASILRQHNAWTHELEMALLRDKAEWRARHDTFDELERVTKELAEARAELAKWNEEFADWYRKLDEGTLHVVYCNGNHAKRVGTEGMVCNCTLGQEIKDLRRERDEARSERDTARGLLSTAPHTVPAIVNGREVLLPKWGSYGDVANAAFPGQYTERLYTITWRSRFPEEQGSMTRDSVLFVRHGTVFTCVHTDNA